MNVKKKVDLFINVRQSFGAKVSDGFELFTTGELKRRKEKWVLEYNNEYNGSTKITLFDNGVVEIVAKGEVCYFLKLIKDSTTKFSCNTKETFSYFSVRSEEIFFDIGENSGSIRLKYNFEVGDTGSVLQSVINILIRERNFNITKFKNKEG